MSVERSETNETKCSADKQQKPKKKATTTEQLVAIPLFIIFVVAFMMVIIALWVNIVPFLEWWADFVRIDWNAVL